MSRKKEIAYLKSLPVEERAKKAEKPMSCLVSSVLFFPCLFLGIYYWTIDEIIFSYGEIPSFLGFFIFFAIGIILPLIASGVNFLYWREYNLLIDQANSDIASLIKRSNGDSDNIERLRTDYVERVIGTEKLTQEDFLWHSNTYCWGCGKKHQITPIKFVIHREKTESWKGRDVMRYSQTFRISDSIMLCPSCHKRFSTYQQIDTKNDKISNTINITLRIIGSLICFAYVLISFISDSSTNIILSILYSFLSGLIFYGIASTLGQIIILPIAYLLSTPFREKNINGETKWSFDYTPKIYHFKNTRLHNPEHSVYDKK